MPREVRRILVFSLLAVCLGATCDAKQLAVIVDKSNNVGGVSSAELARLFKLDSRKWPDGKNVVLVLRDPSTPEMQTAMQKLYHMELNELKRLLAARRDNVVIVKTEQDLLKSVESIPGAVGLVDVYSITSHVRVLKVDGKLPLEPGYYLKGK
jgi:ABC-type phosphate transport system substrate-binding protein